MGAISQKKALTVKMTNTVSAKPSRILALSRTCLERRPMNPNFASPADSEAVAIIKATLRW